MTDFSHLHALETGLSHERERLEAATKPQEIALRTVWVQQYEKQIADEKALLGLDDEPCDMTDEELLAALTA